MVIIRLTNELAMKTGVESVALSIPELGVDNDRTTLPIYFIGVMRIPDKMDCHDQTDYLLGTDTDSPRKFSLHVPFGDEYERNERRIKEVEQAIADERDRLGLKLESFADLSDPRVEADLDEMESLMNLGTPDDKEAANLIVTEIEEIKQKIDGAIRKKNSDVSGEQAIMNATLAANGIDPEEFLAQFAELDKLTKESYALNDRQIEIMGRVMDSIKGEREKLYETGGDKMEIDDLWSLINLLDEVKQIKFVE